MNTLSNKHIKHYIYKGKIKVTYKSSTSSLVTCCLSELFWIATHLQLRNTTWFE